MLPVEAPGCTPWVVVTRHPTGMLVTRRQTVLSSSRATPVSTCPVLRPRWCRQCMVFLCTRDYCLPPLAKRRLSPSLRREVILMDHDYTNFGAQSRSLYPHYTRLHTRCTRVRYGPADHALVRWEWSQSTRTHWVTTTYFKESHLLSQRFRIYLDTTKSWFK